jgi:hypothetical protein
LDREGKVVVALAMAFVDLIDFAGGGENDNLI